MKFSSSFLAAAACVCWAAAPLFSAETVTIAGFFDCTFYDDGESGIDGTKSMSNWTSEQKAAMGRALTTWADTVVNTPGRNLKVGLFWGQYDNPNVLGSAGSPWLYDPDSPAEKEQVFTLVESVWRNNETISYDNTYDFVVNFSKDWIDNFYFGADPTGITSSQLDFESIVLHEVGHAMGITSTTNYDNSQVSFFHQNDTVYYTTFDSLLLNAKGESVVDLAAKSGTASGFTLGETLSLSGTELLAYNPNSWEPGSSIAHVDAQSDPMALMQPSISRNTIRREMTASELQLMSRMNWVIASIPEPATATLSLLGLAALMMRRRRAA